jgi:hypothetical protein
MTITTTKGNKMYDEYEDDGRFRDDLAEHHAAGAAEAQAENEFELDWSESIGDYTDSPDWDI